MSKNWVREVDREGRQSEVELEMRWFYEEGWGEGWEEPRQSALQQLTENSNETKLRLGNIDKVKTMLNNVPILFRFHRVAIRNVRFYLKDLFRGGQGEAEKRMAKQLDAKEARYLEVKHIDWKKLFKPKKEDPGTSFMFSFHPYNGEVSFLCSPPAFLKVSRCRRFSSVSSSPDCRASPKVANICLWRAELEGVLIK